MKNDQEQRAIKVVMAYERRAGRQPEDKSSDKVVYDISSKGRLIEVKSRTARGISFVLLQDTIKNSKKLSLSQRRMFYLYYVQLGKKITIRIIPPRVLFSSLKTVKKYLLPASVISNQKVIVI